MKYIKLSKLCYELQVTKATIYNWQKQGKLKLIKPYDSKLNYVTEDTYNELLNITKTKRNDKVIIYCRVSSSANVANLETQKIRVLNYCNAKGYKVHDIICEVGSGINDNRNKLTKLLSNIDFSLLVVEHKDRLTRFGFNYIKLLFQYANKEIEVINNVDTDEDDLVQDFVSIITSYCARIYGKRRSKRKTEKLIQELKNKND